MREYTILSILSVIIAILADLLLKTHLLKNKNFWKFWLIMFVIIFFVNGYLTWRPVVTYGDSFYLGFRIFTIPAEDFLYGFSLLTLNIVIWEYLTGRKNKTAGNG